MPFSSERKRMSVIYLDPRKKSYIFSKGAPEILL
ncbi:MAG: hypothetical protein KDD45_01335 [Bdellovibrionales bacterium]|nr:hypothetical protein [Bdellovibrionales bacterium]